MSRHHFEAVMALLVALLRGLAERAITPLSVDFPHAAPADTSEHTRVLRAPVRFDRREATLRVRGDDLSTPVFLANPALLAHLESFAQELPERLRDDDSWAGRTGRHLAQRLASGERPSLAAAARAGGVGARQLQNRLRDEGVTFQRLLDGVRRDLATEHLAAGRLSICDVAFMLGFSEQSAFQRAFKRWTGTTPGQAQRHRRAAARARRR